MQTKGAFRRRSGSPAAALLVRLALLGAALSPAAHCWNLSDDLNADVASGHSEASLYFQDVNSYLTQLFGAASGADYSAAFESEVRLAVGAAIKALAANKLAGGQAADTLPAHLEALRPLRTSQTEVLAVLRELASALDSCEQPSLDFLLILLRFHTFQGQVLQRVARGRLNECWRALVARLVRRIDASLGKMEAPLFDFVDGLLGRADRDEAAEAREARRNSKSRQQVSIRENHDDVGAETGPAERSPGQALAQRNSAAARERLKQVSFDGLPAIREFALLLNRAFNEHFGGPASLKQTLGARENQVKQLERWLGAQLLEPCKQLLRRLRNSCADADVFRSNVDQTLGEALVGAAQTNPQLDYQLSVYRICRQTLKHSLSVWQQLSEMR